MNWPCLPSPIAFAVRRRRDGFKAIGHSEPAQRSGAGAQMQFRHAEGQIEPDRGRHRDRLQRDRVVGTADENVGTEASGDRHLAARAEIIAGEKGGAGGRDAVREHRPYHHAAAGGADIEPELADRPVVDLLRAGGLGRERAGDRLLRPDDEADAGRDVAGQDTSPHSLAAAGSADATASASAAAPTA
jgi:hypothetical protein